ncbi:MAG: YegP family protein [Clostridia bacterium]|nr:YegP family protein [Clostridia bacterium]
MGKFVIRNKNDKYSFVLKAGNGEIILVSETYAAEDTCRNGIASVKKNALVHVEDQTKEGYETLKHPKYEVYQDKAGEYRFRLKAINGEIIGTGEGYKAKASCLNGIASIGKNAPEAEIVEEA